LSNGKALKRQRQKEQRRIKMEEEQRQQSAKRRKQMVVNLGVLALVFGAIFYFVFPHKTTSAKKPAKAVAGECSHSKPAGGDTETAPTPPPLTIDKAKTYTAVFETSCGTVEAELAAASSPNTVNSFVFLAKKGFYNGLPFHRIVKDFAVQGGDPKGDGTGGPKYKTTDAPPADFKYSKGQIAMAKGGQEPPGTAGSQFFFVPGDGAATLPPEYAVLGKITKGDDALAKLNNVATKDSGSGEKSSPVSPVYIVKVTIREA